MAGGREYCTDCSFTNSPKASATSFTKVGKLMGAARDVKDRLRHCAAADHVHVHDGFDALRQFRFAIEQRERALPLPPARQIESSARAGRSCLR